MINACGEPVAGELASPAFGVDLRTVGRTGRMRVQRHNDSDSPDSSAASAKRSRGANPAGRPATVTATAPYPVSQVATNSPLVSSTA
jgi:hypothetical protein